MEKILITGTAGFIGFHVAEALLKRGCHVVGMDSHTDYYDPALKEARVARLTPYNRYTHHKMDIAESTKVMDVMAAEKPDAVINLAAQAGVRYSLEAPFDYTSANVTGFLSVLEACRAHPVKHLVFASTSSVYGANEAQPFKEDHHTDHPVSLYAATKKANEMMAHSYAHLFDIPVTGLRFFTVYGPWGRPDMALFKFTKAILADQPIPLFNGGDLARDFTYVDDIVEGVLAALDNPPVKDETWDGQNPSPATSGVAPYRLFNIGNSGPLPLMDFVGAIEEALGKKAKLNKLPMQPGDVVSTHADTARLEAATGYKPNTDVRAGVANFVKWYRDYYKV